MRRLPAATWFARAYLILLCAYDIHLALSGHGVMAVLLLPWMVLCWWALRKLLPLGKAAPRLLVMTCDGNLHLSLVGGQIERVQLGGESLWLGSAVLLVLKAPARTYRVFLGQGNARPQDLSALRRRLLGAATAAETAVHFAGFPTHSAYPLAQSPHSGPAR